MRALLLALLCAVAGVAALGEATVMPDKSILKQEVAEMFDHAFDSYMTYAFPDDELKALTCSGRRRGRDPSRGDMDNVLGNYAMTLIDSLDSLATFGRKREFADAVKYISANVEFERDFLVNVFETTIRVLGGLISGHLLAIDKELNLLEDQPYDNELLRLAMDLGNRLLLAFHTPTGIPYSLVLSSAAMTHLIKQINLKRGAHKLPTTETCLAGAGTLQMEFTSLSMISGDPKYARAALQASRALWTRRSRINLLSTLIDVQSGQWRMGMSTVGAGSDSYYEYLLKMHILTGDGEWLEMWNLSYEAIVKYMRVDDWYLSVNVANGEVVHSAVDALASFLPGVQLQCLRLPSADRTQVLAGDVESAAKSHLNFYRLWRRYGAMPENYDTRTLQLKPGAHHGYPLRPEFIESTYYLYRATRDPFYLEVGWRVLQDINSLTRTKCGFAAVADVSTLQPWVLEDRMDSFFLSETLKYLYLLFDDDNFLNRGEYVFNTEGHPIPLSIATPIQSLGLGVWHEPMECAADQPEKAIAVPKQPLNLTPLRPASAHSAPAGKQIQLPPAAAQQFQILITDPSAVSISAVAGEGIQVLSDLIWNESSFTVAGSVVQFEMRDQITVHVSNGPPLVASPALFGPELNDTCVHSAAVIATPPHACQPQASDQAAMYLRVVIVERGLCPFVPKITNAQAAGATAVLVCDTQEKEVLLSMQADVPPEVPIEIPSFFLTTKSCAALRTALLADSEAPIRIERESIPFGVSMPLRYPGVQAGGGEIQLNSLISALLQSLPRMPQLDPSGVIAMVSTADMREVDNEPMEGDDVACEDTSILPSCSVHPSPTPPSLPIPSTDRCFVEYTPAPPAEACPWPERVVTSGPPHKFDQNGKATESQQTNNAPYTELHDYIIAPPFPTEQEEQEMEERRNFDKN